LTLAQPAIAAAAIAPTKRRREKTIRAHRNLLS